MVGTTGIACPEAIPIKANGRVLGGFYMKVEIKLNDKWYKVPQPLEVLF